MPFAETLDAEAESPKRKRSKRLEAKERLRQQKLIERFNDDRKLCDETRSKWLEEAREAEKYYDGHQYDEADSQKLKKQKRAGLTYNRIAKRVDLVDGTEIYHRQKVVFLPKQPNAEGTTGTSDLATDAVDWVIENCKGMHERSRVWHDSNVRGVGCMSLFMDHEEDPRGRILMKRTDSFEMAWDPNAREMNLEDARWIRRDSWWHLDDIRARFGDDKAGKLQNGQTKEPNATPSLSPDGAGEMDSPTKIINYGANIFQPGAQDVTPGPTEKGQKGMVKVSEVQWWEREPCMLVIDDGSLPLAEMMSDEPPKPASLAPQTNPRLIETPPDPAAMEGMMPPPPEVAPMPGEAPPAPPMGGSVPPGAAPPGSPPSAPPPGMDPAAAAMPPGGAPPDPSQMPPPGPPPEEPPPEEPVEKILSLSIGEWEKLALDLETTGLELPPAVESERRVYKQAFYSDDVLLEDGDMWINGFSYLFLTHKYDSDEKIWYGMVRNLKDPQRGANKFFSQGVDVWSRGAKGALLMERDAAADPNSLPDIWAGPSPIVLMNPGSVTNKQYEIIPPPDFPPAAAQMTQFALEALNDIGPSEAMTGQMDPSGGAAPGVSVQKAQVQGMTTLAPNFDALTRFRYTEAKTIIKMVREFLLDGRLIRIGGPHNSRFEKLLAEKFSDDYDLVIDEVPRDPNARRQVWDQLGPLLPIAFRSGRIPHAWKDFSPFPASVIEEWKKQEDAEASQPPPPDLKTDPKYIAAQIALEEANAELKKAQAMLAVARAQTMIREAGVSTLETLSDIKNENARLQQEQKLGIRDQQHQEDKDTLDALTAIRRESKPASPGVKGTP